MKILLVAINAKYIHSNLAVYSLCAYAKKHGISVEIAEYTMNHRKDFILQEIYKKQADMICFSCYIWNISIVGELLTELEKISPKVPLWVGGPEVSYECERFLQQYPMVTGIMKGEGEETFLALCQYYLSGEIAENQEVFSKKLVQIPGLVVQDKQGKIVDTGDRPPISMDQLPFCYENLEGLDHRIIYYETSRGCPFRCSYCLSSLEKHLRFRSLALVEQELSFFLEQKVPQVKFVDRTFNIKHQHAMFIWKFLKEHDNGITNFHFEVSADLLTDEETDFLSTLRPGLIQLEIGVQSVNPVTIKEIRRTMDLERLEYVVEKIKNGKNIHQHLDLIAGLPYEDYQSFQQSFDRIYQLHPQQLQLGFLKVLKGSDMYRKQQQYGIAYQSSPPYEVLQTKWLSYDQLLAIKKVEEMLEVYYNSGQFEMTISLLEQSFSSPYKMFHQMGLFYEKKELFYRSHSRIGRCEILLDFIKEWDRQHLQLYQETLTFDLYYRENMKSRPSWALDLSLYKEQRRKLSGKDKQVHVEPFFHDFTLLLAGKQKGYPQKLETPGFYLFSYEKRDPLTGQALVKPMENHDL